MPVYKIYFTGHQPVGAVAIVTARSELAAKNILLAKLDTIGLKQDIDKLYATRLDSIDKQGFCSILLDGEY